MNKSSHRFEHSSRGLSKSIYNHKYAFFEALRSFKSISSLWSIVMVFFLVNLIFVLLFSMSNQYVLGMFDKNSIILLINNEVTQEQLYQFIQQLHQNELVNSIKLLSVEQSELISSDLLWPLSANSIMAEMKFGSKAGFFEINQFQIMLSEHSYITSLAKLSTGYAYKSLLVSRVLLVLFMLSLVIMSFQIIRWQHNLSLKKFEIMKMVGIDPSFHLRAYFYFMMMVLVLSLSVIFGIIISSMSWLIITKELFEAIKFDMIRACVFIIIISQLAPLYFLVKYKN